MSFANLKGLSFVLNRINGFARRRTKLTQQNLTTASAGSHIVIQMPNGMIDTQTLSLHGLLTTVAVTAKVSVASIEHVIDSMWLEVNGQQVTQPYKYNDLCHVFESFQMGDKSGVRKIVKAWSPVTAATGVAAAVADNLSSVPFALTNIVPFSSFSPRYVDLSLMGDVRLHIRLAQNSEALVTSATDGTATYSLSDLYMCADLIDLPAEYYQAVSSRLASGGLLEIPFSQWYDISGASQTLSAAGVVVQAQVSSQSIDAVLLTCKSNYQSTLVDTKGRASKHFAFGNANITGSQIFLNNVSYPDYGAVTNAEAFLSAESLLTGMNDTVSQPVTALSSLDNFVASHYLHAERLNYTDGAANVISGINASGAPLQIRGVITGTGGAVYPLLYVATTASLLVGANRQISVRY